MTGYDMESAYDTGLEPFGGIRLWTDDQLMMVKVTKGIRAGSYVPLIKGEYSLVSSYDIYSGINYPFEYMVITIKQKTLETRSMNAGDASYYLYDSTTGDLNIAPKQSDIIHRGLGFGRYVISNIKVSSDTYTITAYTRFESIRSALLPSANQISVYDAFLKALDACGISGVSMIRGNARGTDLEPLKKDMVDNSGDMIRIKDGSYAWRILQICAIHMGLKVFFTGSYVYCVNYRKHTTNENWTYLGEIRLHHDSTDASDPEYLRSQIFSRATTRLSSASDSSDTVKTSISVSFGDQNDVVKYPPDSVTLQSGDSISLTEYYNDKSAMHFAENAVAYTQKPSRSVEFTLCERVKDTTMSDVEYKGGDSDEINETLKPYRMGYEMSIPLCAKAVRIYSDYSEITYCADSYGKDWADVLTDTTMILTGVERSYPTGNTKYIFGNNKPISLDSSLSEIRSATQ